VWQSLSGWGSLQFIFSDEGRDIAVPKTQIKGKKKHQGTKTLMLFNHLVWLSIWRIFTP